MKIKQLTESIYSIDKIYNILSEECAPFKTLSENFKYVPRRMVDDKFVYDEFYEQNILLSIDTRPIRSSLRRRANNSYELFNDMIMDNGHASRVHHMFATSTKGENTLYPINKYEAVWCFPIGKFKYSYIPNDFNGHFKLNAFSQMIENVDELDEKENLVKMVEEYERRLKDELKDDDEEFNRYYRLYVEPMKKQLEKINDIKSTDYASAFKMENELWFNAKSYYIISNHTYDNLKKYINS